MGLKKKIPGTKGLPSYARIGWDEGSIGSGMDGFKEVLKQSHVNLIPGLCM